MPSTPTSAHPAHLRLEREVEKKIVGFYVAGVPARIIQPCLRNDRGYVLPKKIVNVGQAATLNPLDGRTPMDALVKNFRTL